VLSLSKKGQSEGAKERRRDDRCGFWITSWSWFGALLGLGYLEPSICVVALNDIFSPVELNILNASASDIHSNPSDHDQIFLSI